MNSTDGVLRSILEVHCRGCGRAMLGLRPPRREAARVLRLHYDWRCVGGKWFCFECQNSKGTDEMKLLAAERNE